MTFIARLRRTVDHLAFHMAGDAGRWLLLTAVLTALLFYEVTQ